MRVTSGTFYKTYAQSVQDLKSKYNKSMEQVSTGRKYNSSVDDPLSYYAGKKLDNLYQDVKAKNTTADSVKNRLYQQESGALAIQAEMRKTNSKLEFLNTDSSTGNAATVQTVIEEFQTRNQTIVNNLNATYENYYVYGGNDMSTLPFSLTSSDKEDSKSISSLPVDSKTPDGNKSISLDTDTYNTLTYEHKFPGENEVTVMKMRLRKATDAEIEASKKAASKNSKSNTNASVDDLDASDGYIMEYALGKKDPGTGTIVYDNGTTDGSNQPEFHTKGDTVGRNALDKIASAMKEQGRMDLGYGNIRERETLIDTYTGGLNVITGVTSDSLREKAALSTPDMAGIYADIDSGLKNSPVFLISKATYTATDFSDALKENSNSTDTSDVRKQLHTSMAEIIGEWTHSEDRVSNTYRELGVRYALLENTQTALDLKEDTYKNEYAERLGVDTYDAIAEMYANQFSYQAAMKVGSKIMQNSLFDFVQ